MPPPPVAGQVPAPVTLDSLHALRGAARFVRTHDRGEQGVGNRHLPSPFGRPQNGRAVPVVTAVVRAYATPSGAAPDLWPGKASYVWPDGAGGMIVHSPSPDDCWLYPLNGADLVMGVDMAAGAPVGFHEGLPIFVAGATSAAPDRVIDVCMVVDGYGNPTGAVRLTRVIAGELDCVERGPCPEEGCPPKWWCVDGTPTEIAVGGLVPTGAIGPFDSEAEASEVCPLPPVEVVCEDCGTYLFPQTLTVTFTNKTGSAAALPNSVVLTVGTTIGGGCIGGAVPCYGSETYQLGFGGSCAMFAAGFGVQLYFDTVAGFSFGGGSHTLEAGWSAGNVSGPNDQKLTYTIPCNEQLSLPQFVGTVSVIDGFFATGTVDVHIVA